MANSIFEIRQKVRELIERTAQIWQGTEYGEQLEGIENDPIVTLLLSAVSYQSALLQTDISRIKQDVVNDLLGTLCQRASVSARPAAALVACNLRNDVNSLEIDSSSDFKISGFSMMPLLHTTLINANLESMTRIDGRRWKVRLNLSGAIDGLKGFCFAIKNSGYRRLHVFFGDVELPLISSVDSANMPFNDCFTTAALAYNHDRVPQQTMVCFDSMAQQNIRIYTVGDADYNALMPQEGNAIELIFEFEGVVNDFKFSRKQLVLNTVVLTDVMRNSVSLSTNQPVHRIAESRNNQFLYLLPPDSDQIFRRNKVTMRRINADRYDRMALLSQLENLITKFDTDYFAFQDLQSSVTVTALKNLRRNVKMLHEAVSGLSSNSLQGAYIVLSPSSNDVSLTIDYLSTTGSSVNEALSDNPSFTAMPQGVEACSMVGNCLPGCDENTDEKAAISQMRLGMVTGFRLVTPADFKFFCEHELLARYSISRENIKSITSAPKSDGNKYHIAVDIKLADTQIIRRSFEQMLPQMSNIIESLTKTRCIGLYPIKVNITF